MIRMNPFFLILVLFLLSSCDTTKEWLGLRDQQPDAFEVVDRAPLEMPPDFLLTPPEPGKKRPQEMAKREMAAQKVFQSKKQASGKPETNYKRSHGQKLILKNAGTEKRQHKIREQMRVNEEKENQDSFLKQLVSAQKPETINPHEEKKRLEQGN